MMRVVVALALVLVSEPAYATRVMIGREAVYGVTGFGIVLFLLLAGMAHYFRRFGGWIVFLLIALVSVVMVASLSARTVPVGW